MTKPVYRLDVGDPAPNFTLPGTGTSAGRGQPVHDITLSEYRGMNVVLVFYPAAWTPV